MILDLDFLALRVVHLQRWLSPPVRPHRVSIVVYLGVREDIAHVLLLALVVQTGLCVEFGLDDIEGRSGNGSECAGQPSAEIVHQVSVSRLYLEHVLQFLVHEDDHGAEGHVHEEVYCEAAVE